MNYSMPIMEIVFSILDVAIILGSHLLDTLGIRANDSDLS